MADLATSPTPRMAPGYAVTGVGSSEITDDSIVNADIKSNAAIATSKVSGLDAALAAKAPLASPSLTGTVSVGGATSDAVALHGAAPVAQRASAAQAAVATTGATQITPYGFTTSAQADAIVTLVNEIRAALVEKGIIKGSA